MQPPAVVVVAFGSVEHLRGCLAELDRGEDVIVVDNGSDPACAAVCASAGARYVDPGRNLGFAAGVNRGLSLVEPGRDVLLLNPDARLHPDDLVLLQGALHALPRLAAVAPRLAYPDGRRQRTAWPVPSPRQVWRDALGLAAKPPHFLIGAVLLLRGDALAEVGTFDERFFLYAEEADWQLRALRAGWEVREITAVTAVHVSGGTSSDPAAREEHFRRSGELFAAKWGPGWSLPLWRAGSAVAARRRRVVRRGCGQGK